MDDVYEEVAEPRRLSLDLPPDFPVEHLGTIQSAVQRSARQELEGLGFAIAVPMFWNTFLTSMKNDTPEWITVLDGEDPGWTRQLAPGTGQAANKVMPWCNRSYEVKTKAMRIYRENTMWPTTAVVSYFFQDYEASNVCWMAAQAVGKGKPYNPQTIFPNPQPTVGVTFKQDWATGGIRLEMSIPGAN